MKAGSSKQNTHRVENQVPVDVANPLISLPSSSIFKLDADCWNEVFDWLPVDDVHSFGQTCKSLQQVTGKYVQWKCPTFSIWCYLDSTEADNIPDFIQFAQFIAFDSYDELDENFVSNCKALKHVRFVDSSLNLRFIELLKPILSNLITFDIHDCVVDGDIYENCIKHCVKLKNLKIHSDFHRECLLQKYPTLKHIHITTKKPFENDELNTFFKLNPSVRHLTTDGDSIWDNQRSLIESNIKLDDLTIDNVSGMKDEFYDILNDLYQRDFYKRLHVNVYTSPSEVQLAALRGLVTLYVGENVKLPPLTTLKELGFNIDLNRLCNEGLNIAEIPKLLVGLERLVIHSTSMDAILPFIRYSRNLMEIDIIHLNNNVLDISALNIERKKLEAARKVLVYVSEDVYIATKWAKMPISLSLVEIQRSNSNAVRQEHNLRSILNY